MEKPKVKNLYESYGLKEIVEEIKVMNKTQLWLTLQLCVAQLAAKKAIETITKLTNVSEEDIFTNNLR